MLCKFVSQPRPNFIAGRWIKLIAQVRYIFVQVNRELGRRWKNLSAAKRSPYEPKVGKNKERYKKVSLTFFEV